MVMFLFRVLLENIGLGIWLSGIMGLFRGVLRVRFLLFMGVCLGLVGLGDFV